MSDKEFGDALLRGENPIDLQALTARVLRRDRRRVWGLGIVCLLTWMMVVMLPWATVMPAMAKISQTIATMNGLPSPDGAKQTQQQQDLLQMLEVLRVGTIATFLLSVGSMFAAAVMTIVLVVFSRRATLRQVNARLAEISAQIKTIAVQSR